MDITEKGISTYTTVYDELLNGDINKITLQQYRAYKDLSRSWWGTKKTPEGNQVQKIAKSEAALFKKFNGNESPSAFSNIVNVADATILGRPKYIPYQSLIVPPTSSYTPPSSSSSGTTNSTGSVTGNASTTLVNKSKDIVRKWFPKTPTFDTEILLTNLIHLDLIMEEAKKYFTDHKWVEDIIYDGYVNTGGERSAKIMPESLSLFSIYVLCYKDNDIALSNTLASIYNHAKTTAGSVRLDIYQNDLSATEIEKSAYNWLKTVEYSFDPVKVRIVFIESNNVEILPGIKGNVPPPPTNNGGATGSGGNQAPPPPTNNGGNGGTPPPTNNGTKPARKRAGTSAPY
jgi:hypothetical protein